MTFLQFIKISGIAILLLTISSFSNKNQPESLSDFDEPIGTWIDTVILHSPLRENDVTLDLYSGIFFLDDVDSTFFKNHLAGFETDFPSKQKIEFDPTSDYYFFDYQRFNSFVSFTIHRFTKYRSQEFFVYTYDLKSGEITSVSRVATDITHDESWGDSFWFSSDSGKKLTIQKQSYKDEYLDIEAEFDYCYSQSFDSIVSIYHFYPNKTEFTVDTVFSKLDTICV